MVLTAPPQTTCPLSLFGHVSISGSHKVTWQTGAGGAWAGARAGGGRRGLEALRAAGRQHRRDGCAQRLERALPLNTTLPACNLAALSISHCQSSNIHLQLSIGSMRYRGWWPMVPYIANDVANCSCGQHGGPGRYLSAHEHTYAQCANLGSLPGALSAYAALCLQLDKLHAGTKQSVAP